MTKNAPRTHYNAIKKNLTKESPKQVDEKQVELEAVKKMAVDLGVQTNATTVEGIQKAISKHFEKQNKALENQNQEVQ